jgi:ribose-phosphate pyrophosphokinase
MTDHGLIVFSTTTYDDLASRLCSLGAFARGSYTTRSFPDGERYRRLATDVQSRDVVLIGGTTDDRATLELYDLACGVVEYGARSLTLLIPYFGYSTMERAEGPGEIVTAKNRARLLSAIPSASCGNRVALLDLHSAGLPHYFEGAIRPTHVYARPIILAAARRLGGPDFVLACTDSGRAKWVESLANDLAVDAAFVFKRRIDDRHTTVAGVSARVADKRVVIYDDMIRTGSSLLKAAEAYLAAGAQGIAAITTHGIFPGDSLAQLAASGLFKEIVCTDSHPRARELSAPLLTVETTAPLWVEYLKCVMRDG